MPRAARAAAALKKALGIEATLVKGSGGIYTVAVDDAIVAKKTLSAGFPTDDEVILAVRQAIAPS